MKITTIAFVVGICAIAASYSNDLQNKSSTNMFNITAAKPRTIFGAINKIFNPSHNSEHNKLFIFIIIVAAYAVVLGLIVVFTICVLTGKQKTIEILLKNKHNNCKCDNDLLDQCTKL